MIEEMRGLGNEVLHGWAERKVGEQEGAVLRQGEGVKRNGKKTLYKIWQHGHPSRSGLRNAALLVGHAGNHRDQRLQPGGGAVQAASRRTHATRRPN